MSDAAQVYRASFNAVFSVKQKFHDPTYSSLAAWFKRKGIDIACPVNSDDGLVVIEINVDEEC